MVMCSIKLRMDRWRIGCNPHAVVQHGMRSAQEHLVSSDEVDRVFERIFLAGKLDIPGSGFMYATPLLQAATYVPPSIVSKYVG